MDFGPFIRVAALCAAAAACGGGDGGSTAVGSSSTASPKRGLDASRKYTFGPLTAPAGAPILVKTIIGDLNGDGLNDAVTFSNDTMNGSDLVVMYQDASGTFTRSITANSMSDMGLAYIRDIAIADMNGDGRLDLLVFGIPQPVTSGRGAPILILYQDAAGDLGNPTAIPVLLADPNWGMRFAVGDVNGDGRADLVLSGNPIIVMLQRADGTFGADGTFSVNAFALGGDGEVRVADMDADGDNDIVYQAGEKSIGVLKQTAPGVFAPAPELYAVNTSYWSFFNTFAVGDLNGDGRNDVAVLDPGNSGLLNIFLQNSRGTLDPPTFITVNTSPLYGIEIADLDKDGLNDILGEVVDAGSPTGIGKVYVFYQQADHTFRSPIGYTFRTSAGGGSPYHQSLSIGDINNDGWPDAVLAWLDEGVFVLLNGPR